LTVSSDRKFYEDIKDNIAIREIFPERDKLHEFLDSSIDITIKNDDIIYVLQNKNTFSYGIINDIDNDEIKHNCKIEEGNVGAPIISLNNFNVIGMIHEENNSKIGTLLKYHIKKFYEKNNNEKDYKPETELNGSEINNNETMKMLSQMANMNNNFLNNSNNNIIDNFNNNKIESLIKSAKTFNFEIKKKIIFRECGINRYKAFVIECLLSDKVKDVIKKYEKRVNGDNVTKYKCNNKEITDKEKTIKELGLKNNSTIFGIYN